MAKEEYIKNFNGQILGSVERKDNGDEVVRDFPSMQILGYYRKDRDCTTDFYGRIIARGNTAISLIYNKK